MCHAKYYALLEKKRFLSPIGDSPHKILDLGCGTGNFSHWACTARPDTMVQL
jgi:ribosomal protein L11 methylase PrmA